MNNSTEYKITLSKIWIHLKTICKHKFWVMYYCFKCGIPTNIDISDNKNIIFANYKLNTSARYTDTDFNFRYLFLRNNYSSNKVSSIQFVSMASISSDGVWILKEQSESIPIRVFYLPAV